MKISSLLPVTDSYYQNYDFETFIESHIPYIIQNYISIQKDVPENVTIVYKGDFYGLLSSLLIPMDLHYIVMRVNGFYSSQDFTGEAIVVMVPNDKEITLLKNVYKTTQVA